MSKTVQYLTIDAKVQDFMDKLFVPKYSSINGILELKVLYSPEWNYEIVSLTCSKVNDLLFENTLTISSVGDFLIEFYIDGMCFSFHAFGEKLERQYGKLKGQFTSIPLFKELIQVA